jgi:hypothetical protein
VVYLLQTRDIFHDGENPLQVTSSVVRVPAVDQDRLIGRSDDQRRCSPLDIDEVEVEMPVCFPAAATVEESPSSRPIIQQ